VQNERNAQPSEDFNEGNGDDGTVKAFFEWTGEQIMPAYQVVPRVRQTYALSSRVLTDDWVWILRGRKFVTNCIHHLILPNPM